MKWTETSAGTIHAAQQRFWVVCGADADVVAKRMTSSPEFLDGMAKFAIRGGPQPSMGVQRAREIMGANVFGVEEGRQHMNVKFHRFELAGFAEVPATDGELEEMKETHILIAIPSISIVAMRKNVIKNNVYRANSLWHMNQPFAACLGLPGWRLIRKTAVPNSTSCSWEMQQRLLGAKDEVPNSRVLCYMIGGCYLQTGEKLFSDVWVRTSDVVLDGNRVCVTFSGDGVCVNSYWDQIRDDIVAVASVRKSD